MTEVPWNRIGVVDTKNKLQFDTAFLTSHIVSTIYAGTSLGIPRNRLNHCNAMAVLAQAHVKLEPLADGI
jgi:hypothetical protein